ncbi:hypothetical protein [Rhodococcus sp. NPDC047139]|uniref:hypothetical protein n=1 Tax=Rhodococcus sp. NPDC047139 TaxID=3155141 RepID=UPI003411B3D4
MNRLSVVDEMFLHRHKGTGLPSVMQGLWRTDETVDATLLLSLHDVLSEGPLGRRVVRSRIPGARPRFEPNTHVHPLRYPTTPIPDDELLTWADAHANVDVDPELGPGWALAATHLASGGTALSIVCSHVLTDARGFVRAVADALADRPRRPDPLRSSDVRDAMQLLRRVGRGLRAVQYTPRTEKPPVPRTVRVQPRTAVVDVDADLWEKAATAADGTPNSLLLAVVAGVTRRARIPFPVRVSVPVDDRGDGTVSNGVSMVGITIDEGDTVSTIRARATDAYSRPREGAPHNLPAEILQLLPDRLAARASRGAGERDVLCSNIGAVPDELTSLGPYRTTGIAMRAMHPGLGTRPARTATRLSVYACHTADRYTLAFVALDEEHFPDTTALRTHVRTELAERGLEPRFW